MFPEYDFFRSVRTNYENIKLGWDWIGPKYRSIAKAIGTSDVQDILTFLGCITNASVNKLLVRRIRDMTLEFIQDNSVVPEDRGVRLEKMITRLATEACQDSADKVKSATGIEFPVTECDINTVKETLRPNITQAMEANNL